ncbi:MAG: hypothetical protein KA885_10740 [Spirochaetes bacterium]|nr:hypothetical protein [Spirochaetota bacterium]
MTKSVRISKQLLDKALIISKIENRKIEEQIEYWAKMGELALENQDLPMNFIKDILISREEAINGNLTEYKFGL